MISYYKRSVKDKALEVLENFSVGSWISVVNPTQEELKLLSDRFGLDEQNLLSGLDRNEVPRIEFEDGLTYIIVKILSRDAGFLDTCLIVVSDRYILTLSRAEPLFTRKILDGKIDLFTTQRLKTLIKFLSLISKEFEKETMESVRIVNAKKSESEEMPEKDLRLLLHHEEKLNSYISSYTYMKPIYERMLKKTRFFEDDKEMIEDLLIDSEQGLDICRSSLKTISNIRNYQTIILSNKTSRTITTLTIVTIFFSIFTAIFGFYGMNIPLPFQDSPYAYALIAVFSFLAGLAIAAYLKKEL
ncbi:MAG: hypothetical protein JW727_03545 [Candidatus Aenigmarchaeota archaeon]|nr:hypothetical protein [Candidatus Aenigmarchaeota archaeon]